ncbi:MAG: AMIN domain-containing protein [Proteobacteria bacterium]|nr:AMIN domain-containing protein [Desulfobulbaceae bacterium]MBU4154195.1 AMIN domain-containing protein [Pseudomonadota bacterium]
MNIQRLTILCVMFLTLTMSVVFEKGCLAQADGEYQASSVVFEKVDGGLSLTIKGNMSPTFTTYQLFDPMRVVVDIANAGFADSLHLPIEVNQSPVAMITGTILAEKKPVIAKLEIALNSDSEYTVKRDANDITIIFAANSKESVAPSPPLSVGTVPVIEEASQRGEGGGLSEIYDMKVKREGTDSVSILLVADGPIQDYTKVDLTKGDGRPDRMYLDLPRVKAPALDRDTEVGAGGLERIRISDRAEGARFVFDSSFERLFNYTVAPAPEGILISIAADGGVIEQEEPEDPVAQVLASSVASDKKVSVLHKQLQQVGITGDEFAEAGYDRQKISVDFYKTNLHNVFRLMGEVGGYNIVVDDSVSGVLTLSLREVPWDFLLDVIMNLKGLQKEERYNTIVISAKEKGFVWPEKATAKSELGLEAPEDDMVVAIDKKLSDPPAVVEAKMLVQRGNSLVQEGKFKEALGLYQKALDKWPTNAELAKRIAGVCLVNLGYHQAGVDYAKKALALNPDDLEASLQAAVGSANMRRPEAQQYFEKAVSGKKPSRSALLSFISFQEESSNFAGAMATLAQYNQLYGASLEIMIAKARILDKQGKSDLAVAEYKSIMYSGYELAPDLIQYIKGRIALANTQ